MGIRNPAPIEKVNPTATANSYLSFQKIHVTNKLLRVARSKFKNQINLKLTFDTDWFYFWKIYKFID